MNLRTPAPGRGATAAMLFAIRAVVRAAWLATTAAAAAARLFAAAAAPARAAPPEPTALIDQQHCMFCHTSDAPFLAPSFHQIAGRYRKVPDAEVMLEQKLRLGGRAHWGDMPMPPPEDRGGPLSPDDAHTLIEWVMSQ